MRKLYKNKGLLYKKYIDEKKSVREIADICECHNTTIWYWLKKYEIKTRTNSESHIVPLKERFWEKVDKNIVNRRRWKHI